MDKWEYVIKRVYVNRAKESILFFDKLQNNNSKHPDILATFCFEMLKEHVVFLKMNYNNFTMNVIDRLDDYIQCKSNSLNVFTKELTLYRDQLIIKVIKNVDLYKYNTTDLKILNKKIGMKKYHSYKKKDLINNLKRNIIVIQ
tara:strand:- start:224 stop:652 length:429 start_codon:yes stop_codon:yes gene_type:complete